MGVHLLILLLAAGLARAEEWPRFRGINGSGVSPARGLPVEFGPDRNVVWRTPLPPGHSSPVITGNYILVTAGEGGNATDAGRQKVVDQGGRLWTIALDRHSGKVLWRQEAPRERLERYQPTNSPASPSPVTDGENVYVFFGDFGVLSYTLEGKERWRLPLGPFNNVNGHGSSPILYGDLLILLCDQDTDSYLLAVNKHTGKVSWKVERHEFTRSYTTPSIFEPRDGPAELIIPGAYQLTSYEAATGRKLWWLGGMSWQPKSTPVIQGDMIYAHWWEGGGEAESTTYTPTFAEILEKGDKDGDGRIAPEELAAIDPRMRHDINDLDSNGFLEERDWESYRGRLASRNTLVAIRHRGNLRGDLAESEAVVWRMQKFLPNVPSPLIYRNVLYLVKDGGILTSLDPSDGRILKQGRLRDALDTYYSSPVGADGKVYLISQQGKVTVLRAGGEWEILAVNDLEDECYATPAPIGDRLYLRTRHTLYCFAERGRTSQ